MSFFTVVGMIVSGIVALAIAGVVVLLIVNFIGYQKGARNYRDYVYYGQERGQWFWTKYGTKCWARSFTRGGGWFVRTSDPENDKHDLYIYEDGKIVRHKSRFAE